jgi:hypothetical protein
MVIVRKGMAAEFLREIVNPFELPPEESGPQRKPETEKTKPEDDAWALRVQSHPTLSPSSLGGLCA